MIKELIKAKAKADNVKSKVITDKIGLLIYPDTNVQSRQVLTSHFIKKEPRIELSKIKPLCKILGISVDEFLSIK